LHKISKKPNIKNLQKLLINQAIQFHLKGNIPEAKKCYKRIIDQGCNDYKVFANYGVILKILEISKKQVNLLAKQ